MSSSTLTARKTIPNDLLFARALDGALDFTSISTVRILHDLYGVNGTNDHAHLLSDEVTD